MPATMAALKVSSAGTICTRLVTCAEALANRRGRELTRARKSHPDDLDGERSVGRTVLLRHPRERLDDCVVKHERRFHDLPVRRGEPAVAGDRQPRGRA